MGPTPTHPNVSGMTNARCENVANDIKQHHIDVSLALLAEECGMRESETNFFTTLSISLLNLDLFLHVLSPPIPFMFLVLVHF